MKQPTTSIAPNMLLFTSYWNDAKTFKLLPATEDCPFIEVIYDPSIEMLVVINKLSKSTFHNVPKLDQLGDVEMAKSPRKNGKPYKEERRSIETYQEYYLTEKEEQIKFIETFAINWNSFNFRAFMDKEEESKKEKVKKEKGAASGSFAEEITQ